jgi:hypothetical protein
MTQYLMSVIHDWDDPGLSEEEIQTAYQLVDAFNTELQQNGQWVFGGGLTHPAGANVVDGRKGEAVITDGPYVEVKEQLGGFWVVETADRDEALELARRASAACLHPVEVRAFQAESSEEG